MNQSDFIKELSKITHQELNEYIKEYGKKKDPKSYDVPWSIDMTLLKSKNLKES